MKLKPGSSFPCLVWLSEQTGEQRQELQQRPGFDCVFFSSGVGFQRLLDPRALRVGAAKQLEDEPDREDHRLLQSQRR